MSVDVHAILKHLAETRPIFHSEADLQLAFGLATRELLPGVEIRLERRVELPATEYEKASPAYVDVLVHEPGGASTAVELKYPTAAVAVEVDGEQFALRDHGAHDLRRYDVLLDVRRLERMVEANDGWNGYSITLTNASGYWSAPVSGRRRTVDHAFRIHEGTALGGRHAWGELASEGTMRGRVDAIHLIGGPYTATWEGYPGRVDGFRMLVISVGGRPSRLAGSA